MSVEPNGEPMKRLIGGFKRTPEEVLAGVRALHGVGPGEVACPCGWVYDLAAYPTMHCKGCHRPLATRCRGISESDAKRQDADLPESLRIVAGPCLTLIQPVKYERGEYDYPGTEDRWSRPADTCDECKAAVRAATVASLIGQAIPRDLIRVARQFRPIPERSTLEDVLRSWWRGGCKTSQGKTAIYAHGNTGIGKSVAMAWACAKAVADDVIHGSDILWLYESEIVDAAKTMYRDESDGARIIKRASTVRVLVIEELFSRSGPVDPTHRASGWTEHSARVVSEILCRRFQSELPTLMTSNEPPAFDSVFDNRVKSRFAACGVVVNVHGPDLREQAVTL